jgi:hypothetical protein
VIFDDSLFGAESMRALRELLSNVAPLPPMT